MFDFSTLKALTVPEGSVKKITVDGEVKWTKAEAEFSYTPIDYIQFTGSQRIDTGIICNRDTKIEVKFARESASDKYLLGVRDSANAKSITAYLTSSGAWRFGNTYASFSPQVNTIYEAVLSKSGLTVNSSKYSFGTTVNSFETIATLTLGSARSTSGALTSPQFVGKMYYFRMYNGDNLVLDYAPVVRNDGVYGFFDNVSGEFKGSETSTPF